MSLAVIDRHATGEACFGFFLSLSMLHFPSRTSCPPFPNKKVTVMLLEEKPCSAFIGKLCEEHGYTYHWKSGQNPHLIKNGKRIDCKISNYVPLSFLEHQRVLPLYYFIYLFIIFITGVNIGQQ